MNILIDTHAHLNFIAFEKDLDKIIKRSLDQDILMINIGTNYQTSKKAIEISKKYKGVFAVVGLHPINLDSGLIKMRIDENEFKKGQYPFEKEFNFENYKELILQSFATEKKVVAIGEIGLDYWWTPKTKKKKELFKEKQKELLIQELNLAKELKLPVIFHCRLAHEDLLEILKVKVKDLKIKGVIHCFTGNWEQAKKYLEMGFYLGFNGIIFKLNLDEVIKKTPIERIVLETDCPYLTPPQKKDKRNEPLNVKYIAQKIAEIKNISFEKLSEITTQNAKNLFNLKD